MTRFASLFPSPEHAEQAYQSLTGRMGEAVDARILGHEDWLANWNAAEGKRPKRRPAEFYIDLWLNDEAVRYFTEGLKRGGAVLVISVPEELSHQAERVVRENQGKPM